MILHDCGFGVTSKSLAFFENNKDRLGKIVRVEMKNYYTDRDGWETYPLRIVGFMAEIWLSGCSAGYCGEGPHGTAKILEALGYPAEYRAYPFTKSSFILGPPINPANISGLNAQLTQIEQEVLDFVGEYFDDHGGDMPQHVAIAAGTGYAVSTVRECMRAMERAGIIVRFSRQPGKYSVVG